MINEVRLTDDELSAIATSLEMSIMSCDKYIQDNGEEALDQQTKSAIEDIGTLLIRLNKEFF